MGGGWVTQKLNVTLHVLSGNTSALKTDVHGIFLNKPPASNLPNFFEIGVLLDLLTILTHNHNR